MAVWSEVDGEARRAVTGFGLSLSLSRTKLLKTRTSDRHATIAADLFPPL